MKASSIADICVVVAYAVVANPVVTGVSVHEWLALVLAALVVLHCARHGDRVERMVHALRSGPDRASHAGVVFVDALMGLSFAACVVSGLLTSGYVMRSLGLYAAGYTLWNPLHALSAKLLLAFLLVHLALHARELRAWASRRAPRMGGGRDA